MFDDRRQETFSRSRAITTGDTRPFFGASFIRDARDRAERAAADRDNQGALEDLLDRAEKTGDAQLAKAAYHVATLRGARHVANAYLAERPTAQRRWESYVEARQEADPLNMDVLASVVGPQRPPELAGG